MEFLCFCSSEAFSVQRLCENASSNSHYQPTFGYTCACITYIHFCTNKNVQYPKSMKMPLYMTTLMKPHFQAAESSVKPS